jgi:hypothetical protein
MSIFISIASYRDPRLWPTVADALEQAADPQALHFAVVDQSEAAAEPPPELQHRAGALSYLHLHHRFSRGPCWARSIAASYCQGEPYFLQIDAHMVFDRHWDRHLVEQLEALSARNPRTILSTYPAPFELVDGQPVRRPIPGHALVLEPRPGSVLGAESPVLGFRSRAVASREALPGCHVGAGCLFTRSAFIAEVPYDPWLYFHGEEQNLAVRAWTHGWDIQHVPDMPIYHLYHGGDGRPVHWAEGDDVARPTRWWELERSSQARMRALLYDGVYLGVYGLGRARSLQQYAEFSGIDYPNRTCRAPE